jgi:hypothetical protein
MLMIQNALQRNALEAVGRSCDRGKLLSDYPNSHKIFTIVAFIYFCGQYKNEVQDSRSVISHRIYMVIIHLIDKNTLV